MDNCQGTSDRHEDYSGAPEAKRQKRGVDKCAALLAAALSEEKANGSSETSRPPPRGRGGRPNKSMMTHVETEQRRRDKINEGFAILRDLIPHKDKMDKAAFLAETVKYVREVQDVLNLILDSGALHGLPDDPSAKIRAMLPVPEGSSEGGSSPAAACGKGHGFRPVEPSLTPPLPSQQQQPPAAVFGGGMQQSLAHQLLPFWMQQQQQQQAPQQLMPQAPTEGPKVPTELVLAGVQQALANGDVALASSTLQALLMQQQQQQQAQQNQSAWLSYLLQQATNQQQCNAAPAPGQIPPPPSMSGHQQGTFALPGGLTLTPQQCLAMLQSGSPAVAGIPSSNMAAPQQAHLQPGMLCQQPQQQQQMGQQQQNAGLGCGGGIGGGILCPAPIRPCATRPVPTPPPQSCSPSPPSSAERKQLQVRKNVAKVRRHTTAARIARPAPPPAVQQRPGRPEAAHFD